MRRDLVIFVNGILTRPGNAFAWTDNAVRWVNRQVGAQFSADKFEYYSPALLRRLTLSAHAQDLARTLADYVAGGDAVRLHLVGHSNACELKARALEFSGVSVASVHLISAALERDFTRNGLGERLDRGQIGAVFCYCSHGDAVLRYLAPASRWASFGLLGYGDLGYRGPAGVRPGQRVETHWEQSYGHGDWFAGANLETTLARVFTNIARSTSSPA